MVPAAVGAASALPRELSTRPDPDRWGAHRPVGRSTATVMVVFINIKRKASYAIREMAEFKRGA